MIDMSNALVNQKALDAKIVNMKGLLEKLRPQLKSLLPKHIEPDRMIRFAINAIRSNPRLLEADPRSFMMALLHCAIYGLEPNTPMHEASLIPFMVTTKDAAGNYTKRMEVQVIAEYYGLMKLGRNTGEIASIEARPVFQNDEFEVDYGSSQPLKHKPCLDGDRGELRCSYCRVTFKDPLIPPYIEVMTADDIAAVRKSSKMATNPDGPWVKSPDQMWRKSPIRRAFKYLPKSPELARFMATDDQADAGEPQQYDEEITNLLYDPNEISANAEVEKPSRADEIAKDLGVKAAEKPAPEEGAPKTISEEPETVPKQKPNGKKENGKADLMNKDERDTIAMLLNNKVFTDKKSRDVQKLAVDMLKSKVTTSFEAENIIGKLSSLPGKEASKADQAEPGQQSMI
jgi:recombination protein RecT